MIRLASVIDTFAVAFRAQYGSQLSAGHLQALAAMRRCRTPGAANLHLRAGLRTAALHRCECLQMPGRQLAAVLGAEVDSEGIDHRGQADHLT